VLLLAGSLAAWLAGIGADRFSLPLFVMFAAFVLLAPDKRLYATMFLVALAMELYGTAMGNWTWRPIVPGTGGMTTLNPPLAAGAFYCLLDWAVNLQTTLRQRIRTPDHSLPAA
jgi:hypothetical protein